MVSINALCGFSWSHEQQLVCIVKFISHIWPSIFLIIYSIPDSFYRPLWSITVRTTHVSLTNLLEKLVTWNSDGETGGDDGDRSYVI